MYNDDGLTYDQIRSLDPNELIDALNNANRLRLRPYGRNPSPRAHRSKFTYNEREHIRLAADAAERYIRLGYEALKVAWHGAGEYVHGRSLDELNGAHIVAEGSAQAMRWDELEEIANPELDFDVCDMCGEEDCDDEECEEELRIAALPPRGDD